MSTSQVYTLINPQNGNLAFKIFPFEDGSNFDHLQRLNYYSLIIIKNGTANLKADFSEYRIEKKSLLCFSPYQPFMLADTKGLTGIAINFHPDFFCIHKHHREVACSGVLFNNIYSPPYLSLAESDLQVFLSLAEQIKAEMKNTKLAQYELLVSYLKIFLINASRMKISQHPEAQDSLKSGKEPFILQKLKEAIEQHYKTKHSASEYASLLNIPLIL